MFLWHWTDLFEETTCGLPKKDVFVIETKTATAKEMKERGYGFFP